MDYKTVRLCEVVVFLQTTKLVAKHNKLFTTESYLILLQVMIKKYWLPR